MHGGNGESHQYLIKRDGYADRTVYSDQLAAESVLRSNGRYEAVNTDAEYLTVDAIVNLLRQEKPVMVWYRDTDLHALQAADTQQATITPVPLTTGHRGNSPRSGGGR